MTDVGDVWQLVSDDELLAGGYQQASAAYSMWLRIRANTVLICRSGEARWSWCGGLRLLRAGSASTIRRDAAVD